jgi:hypothetical protein
VTERKRVEVYCAPTVITGLLRIQASALTRTARERRRGQGERVVCPGLCPVRGACRPLAFLYAAPSVLGTISPGGALARGTRYTLVSDRVSRDAHLHRDR